VVRLIRKIPLLLAQIKDIVRLSDFKSGDYEVYHTQTSRTWILMKLILDHFEIKISEEKSDFELYSDFLCLHSPIEKVKKITGILGVSC